MSYMASRRGKTSKPVNSSGIPGSSPARKVHVKSNKRKAETSRGKKQSSDLTLENHNTPSLCFPPAFPPFPISPYVAQVSDDAVDEFGYSLVTRAPGVTPVSISEDIKFNYLQELKNELWSEYEEYRSLVTTPTLLPQYPSPQSFLTR